MEKLPSAGLFGLASILGCLTSVPALSQETWELGADAFLGEVAPPFVTVTRLPQNLSETPASVMIIDRQMIEAAGALEVADLLRLVPGFLVGHYVGNDGDRTVVSYYGASDQHARRLLVLVDGVSVYVPSTGGVEWPDLPLAVDDVERIEVVRGPNGAAYGSNAFLGVINIITRHPQETETKAAFTAGSIDYREGMFRIAGGEQFQYRITGGYRSSSGYSDLGFSEIDHEVNDDSITRSLSLRSDYRASVNDYWTLQAGYANGPRGVGESMDPMDPPRELEMETDYEQIRWRRIFDSDSEFEMQVYRNYHRKSDAYETAWVSELLSALEAVQVGWGPVSSDDVPIVLGALGLPPQSDQRLQVDTSVESERSNLEASYRFRPAREWRVVGGGEYRIDRVRGKSYFDTGETFRNEGTRLFFNGEWKPDQRWIVNLGDLYEKNDLIGSAHSPRLSLSRKLREPHFVRATASRAYRIPAFYEENFNFVYRFNDGTFLHQLFESPGALDPERIDSVELAFAGEEGTFSYELKTFRNQLTSLIAIPTVDSNAVLQTGRVLNGGELTIEGTEFQATLRPQPDVLVSLGAALAHGYGWIPDSITPEKRKDLAESVPERTFSLLFSKRFANGARAGFAFYSVSPVRNLGGNLTEGVDTADINYMHPFIWNGYHGKVRWLFRDIMGSYFDFEKETAREYQAFLTLEAAL